jgi:hypothetical protein
MSLQNPRFCVSGEGARAREHAFPGHLACQAHCAIHGSDAANGSTWPAGAIQEPNGLLSCCVDRNPLREWLRCHGLATTLLDD